MKKVESGKTVSVNYTGKFDNGEVFDTSLSKGREPLHIILGQGSLIPGFELRQLAANNSGTVSAMRRI